jgi:hypothetical protein
VSKLDNAVAETDAGWDFVCPVTDGTCGANGTPFTSTGWPSKKTALARGQEHLDDHAGTPMSSLEAFRAKHGLAVTDDGKAVHA